jgi:cyclopropane fatty-acyl-phospholipid synthase-like methyltransferase
MNPNKTLWEKGDFTRIASSMRESGEAFVGTLGIVKGLKVLDLGCGDGTTAIPAATRGAECSASTSRATWSRPETIA